MSPAVRRALVWAAAIATAALTARLGVWQLDRAQQKLEWQAATERQRTLPALAWTDLGATAQMAAAQVHRPVVLRGQWLPEHTVFLDNRQMNGQPGFFVLTPLRHLGGSTVLVQRGWWPRDRLDRSLVSAPPPPGGEVEVWGRIALGPARLAELGADSPGRLRQNLDVAGFARESRLTLLPLLVVQEDPPESAPAVGDGLKRDWLQPATGTAKHHGYAAQWFALCALVVGLTLWFQIIRPWRHRTRPHP